MDEDFGAEDNGLKDFFATLPGDQPDTNRQQAQTTTAGTFGVKANLSGGFGSLQLLGGNDQDDEEEDYFKGMNLDVDEEFLKDDFFEPSNKPSTSPTAPTSASAGAPTAAFPVGELATKQGNRPGIGKPPKPPTNNNNNITKSIDTSKFYSNDNANSWPTLASNANCARRGSNSQPKEVVPAVKAPSVQEPRMTPTIPLSNSPSLPAMPAAPAVGVDGGKKTPLGRSRLGQFNSADTLHVKGLGTGLGGRLAPPRQQQQQQKQQVQQSEKPSFTMAPTPIINTAAAAAAAAAAATGGGAMAQQQKKDGDKAVRPPPAFNFNSILGGFSKARNGGGSKSTATAMTPTTGTGTPLTGTPANQVTLSVSKPFSGLLRTPSTTTTTTKTVPNTTTGAALGAGAFKIPVSKYGFSLLQSSSTAAARPSAAGAGVVKPYQPQQQKQQQMKMDEPPKKAQKLEQLPLDLNDPLLKVKYGASGVLANHDREMLACEDSLAGRGVAEAAIRLSATCDSSLGNAKELLGVFEDLHLEGAILVNDYGLDAELARFGVAERVESVKEIRARAREMGVTMAEGRNECGDVARMHLG